MTNVVEFRQAPRKISVLERINKKEVVYLCIENGTDNVNFGTPSYSQAHEFARLHNCWVSECPIGTYTQD